MLAAIVVAGCGGGSDNPASSSCQTQAGPIPVSRFAYSDSTFLTGTNVDLSPTIELVPGGSLANATLRFELVSGPLPSGLTLDPATGRISGKVAGPPGGFPFTVRLSADCFGGSVTTSAFFTVT
jgi:Putative Ig domain